MKTNARVPRLGRSDSVTAAAASARRSRSGSCRRERPSSSEAGSSWSGSGTSKGGGLLGEEPLERRAAGDVRLGEHALLGLGELVGQIAAQRAQVVSGECELRGLEQLVGTLVGHEVPLEVEEEQLGLDRGAELAGLLNQRAARRVRRIERIAQYGVGARAPAEVVDLRQLMHRLGQLRHVQLRDAAAVALGECLGTLACLGQHLLDGLGASALDQRLEVPGGGFQLFVCGGAHRGRG